jgi:hypothetical protein
VKLLRPALLSPLESTRTRVVFAHRLLPGDASGRWLPCSCVEADLLLRGGADVEADGVLRVYRRDGRLVLATLTDSCRHVRWERLAVEGKTG